MSLSGFSDSRNSRCATNTLATRSSAGPTWSARTLAMPLGVDHRVGRHCRRLSATALEALACDQPATVSDRPWHKAFGRCCAVRGGVRLNRAFATHAISSVTNRIAGFVRRSKNVVSQKRVTYFFAQADLHASGVCVCGHTCFSGSTSSANQLSSCG
jgi:hypothetical protein